MECDWQWSTLGEEARNASRPFRFQGRDNVVFVNTGDVFEGRFLHADLTEVDTLPGQAKKAIKGNDILLSEIRPGNGRFLFVGEGVENYVVSTKFMVIESRGRVLPRLLYHLLTNRAALAEFQRIAEGRSATFPQVTFDSLSHFAIPVLARTQQQKLTSYLDQIGERLALFAGASATLEAIAQTLFKSWFVDFDPVYAKAEGREPEAMDAATAALFPSEFEVSELGLIPKAWRPGTLNDVSHLNAMSWSTKQHPDTVAYVDLSAVHTNRIVTISEFLFSEAPSRARRSLRDGDTVVGTVRPGNRAFAYIHSPAANLTGSTGFAVLSPKDAIWAPFVYLAATRNDSIDRLSNLADGGAYPAVRPDVVAATPVVIPLPPIITAFSLAVASLLHKIGENQAEEATLAELRDTLLPRLISGKLRLPGAEHEIEATT